MNLELFDPFLTKPTTIHGQNTRTATGQNLSWFQGFLNNTTSYTAFTLNLASGTFTGGTIRVYGYRN
jgi:beta-lactamase class D